MDADDFFEHIEYARPLFSWPLKQTEDSISPGNSLERAKAQARLAEQEYARLKWCVDTVDTFLRLGKPAIPLVTLDKEVRVLRAIDAILYSPATKKYIEAGEALKPKGALTIQLPEGTMWKDKSGYGLHSRPGLSAEAHFDNSMYELNHIPAIAALLCLVFPHKNPAILYEACSWGLGMRMIQQAGYRNVQGIDIDQAAISFDKQRGLNAQVIDAGKTPFASESFDAIVSRDFLVRSYKPFPASDENEMAVRIQIFNEQYRLLKYDGVAILTEALPGRPLDERDFPKRELAQSDLSLARHIIHGSVAERPNGPLSHSQDVYHMWIFKK